MVEPIIGWDKFFEGIKNLETENIKFKERIKELETELEKPPEDILVCNCGWWGSMEQQDALGSECGCCPSCGNEALVLLSKLQGRLKELGVANKQLLELSENLDEHPEGYDGPCLCKLCKSYG